MESKKLVSLSKSCLLLVAVAGFVWLTGCSSESGSNEQNTTEAAHTDHKTESEPAASDKGVGPVSNLALSETIDQALVDQGKSIFESKCAACHKFDQRYVGPPLGDVTERRKPEWIMNMVLNPQEMLEKDPVAKELLGEYMTPMPNQGLTQEEARAVLEYFRSLNKK